MSTQPQPLLSDFPGTPATTDATTYVKSIVHPQIFNHSQRVFLLGHHAAIRDGAENLDAEALFLAAIFHDVGTSDAHNGASRFEIEGADAAANFLEIRGWASGRIDTVWEAIALHTTPQIPARRGPITNYLWLGVEIEFASQNTRMKYAEAVSDAESRYSRHKLEETLQTLLIEQAIHNPQKAQRPSWVGDLIAHHVPGRPGINPGF